MSESFSKSIKQKYGENKQKLTNQLQRITNKIVRIQNHIKFLKRCRDMKMIPHGLRIKLPEDCNNKTMKRKKTEIEMSRLRNKISNLRKTAVLKTREYAKIKETLENTFETADYKWLQSVIEKSEKKEKNKIKDRHIKKLNQLILEEDNKILEDRENAKDMEQMKKLKITKEVVDLTTSGVDEDIKAYLSLGPDFCEAPLKIPYEKIISVTEKMCDTVESEGKEEKKEKYEIEREIDELREDVAKVLQNAVKIKLKPNLTRQEKNGKRKAMQDTQKVYLPADKGRIMVIMDKFEETGGENSYEVKMREVLKDLKAKPSVRGKDEQGIDKDWDLTKKVCRDCEGVINNIVDSGEISEKLGKWLKPIHCHAPRLSGLPKIHKDDIPLRGIVSTVGTPYERLSRYLIPILKSLQGRSGLYIKNSRELKERVKDWRIERNEMLVSYDVKNLYPSIPISEALELVEVLLKGNPKLYEVTPMSAGSIMAILKWMFSLTYCEYWGKHYVLNSGPIGLGATGEIAIIYMEEFQIKAVKESPYPLLQWFWYVDDSETKCKTDESEQILEYLNKIEPNVIVFTKEDEKDNILPVLDLKQTVNRRTKKIECTVHYKSTHTNINVKENSNHPAVMKKGIIKGFADRAKTLCDDGYLEDELKNIEDVFVANGYPRKVVKGYMTAEKKKKNDEEEQEKDRGTIVVPYVKGFSARFKKIAQNHKFRVAHTPGRKIRAMKSLSQTPLGKKQKELVYRIPCGCGNAVYTGETWRSLETRQKEHKKNVEKTREAVERGNLEEVEKRMGKEDGGVPRHDHECTEDFEWEKVEIVVRERDTNERRVREAIETTREKHHGRTTLNSYTPIDPWKPTLARYFDTEIDRGAAAHEK